MMKPVKAIEVLSSQTLAELNSLIGVRNTRKLCRAFGGSALYIPKLEGIDRPRRNRQIRADAAHGASVAQLCATYRLYERQVRRILSAQRQKDFWSEPW